MERPPPPLAAICQGASTKDRPLDLEVVSTPRTGNGLAAARKFPAGSLVRVPL